MGYYRHDVLLVFGKFCGEGRRVKLPLSSTQSHCLCCCSPGSGQGWWPLGRWPGAGGERPGALFRGVDKQVDSDGIPHSDFCVPLLEGLVLACSTIPGWPALLQLPLDVL